MSLRGTETESKSGSSHGMI